MALLAILICYGLAQEEIPNDPSEETTILPVDEDNFIIGDEDAPIDDNEFIGGDNENPTIPDKTIPSLENQTSEVAGNDNAESLSNGTDTS